MRPTYYIFLSVLAALILGLAFYPGVTGTLVFIGLVPLFWIEDDIDRQLHRRHPGFMLLVAFGTFFLWNVIVLWWAGKASISGAAAVIIINAFLYALVFWLFHLSKRKFGPGFGYAALLFYWLAFEYAHSWWVLAMPWLKLGHALGNDINLIQWYDVTGTAGGTAWIIFVNVLLFKVLHYWVTMRSIKGSLGNLLLLLVFIVAPVILSLNRNVGVSDENGAEVAVVQPNINTWHDKFDTTMQAAHVSKFIALAEAKVSAKTKLVVGPESMITRGVWEDTPLQNIHLKQLHDFTRKYSHLAVMTGAMTFQNISENQTLSAFARTNEQTESHYIIHNSAIFLQQYQMPHIYNKNRLLPGVETMPFPKLMEPYAEKMVDLGGISGLIAPGERPEIFRAGSLKIAPLICWEAVFGSYTSRFSRLGANLIAVMANDGWWGNSPGYKMHLMYSKIRAIEQRRSVVRAANTGISAIISPRGEIVKAIGWDKADAIKARVVLNNEDTYYAAKGAYIGRMAVFFAFLLVLYTIVHYILPRNKLVE